MLDLARIPVLETPRLRLRGPRGEDLELFAEIMRLLRRGA